MNKPIVIGLCGRSGSGKGYVCQKFEQYGIPSVDTDAVYRDMTSASLELSPCMQELQAAFGDGIVCPDHSLNRSVMAKIVFGSDGAAARNTLNRITHKHILQKVSEKIDRYAMQGYSCVIVDAPLLFESGFDKLCRFTVCVTASDETSVRRIVRRDGISETDARRRLLTQIPAKELIARCDFHILNEMGSDTLDGQIAQVIASMREMAGESR